MWALHAILKYDSVVAERQEKEKMKKVQVLLSAYNGEKYLAEQIESILQQDYREVSLLIRDDGSTDHTLDIIRAYSEQYENIAYYAGENLGVQKSFFHLMQHADETADYYAFSDQDDVWLPEKIRRAVELLDKQDQSRPLLYSSKTTLVDAELKEIPMKIKASKIVPDFGNALVENVCTGCTEVFNKRLLNLINQNTPECTIMHDWWLYLSASAFGKVVYDSDSFILYRQHGNNQMGVQSSLKNLWKSRLVRVDRLKYSLSKQAQSFIEVYGNQYEVYYLALSMANYREHFSSRLGLALSKKIHRQRKGDDVIFRVLFVLGLL